MLFLMLVNFQFLYEGFPVEGNVPPSQVVYVAKELYNMGCSKISLWDTIGVADAPILYVSWSILHKASMIGDMPENQHLLFYFCELIMKTFKNLKKDRFLLCEGMKIEFKGISVIRTTNYSSLSLEGIVKVRMLSPSNSYLLHQVINLP